MKKTFDVKTYTLCDRRIKKGCRIAFLTDLHSHIYGEDEQDLIRAIDEARPDLILIGGDMMVVKTYANMDLKPLDDILSALAPKYKVYYAIGNHEQRMHDNKETYPGAFATFKELLTKHRVHLLVGKGIELESGVTITGIKVPRFYYKKIRLKKPVISDLIFTNKDCFNIFLAHTPAYIERAWNEGADLVLCGHYHGGVMRLPKNRGLVSPQFIPFASKCWGLYEDKKDPTHKAIISPGLGTHSVNLRIFNPPELSIIDLQPSNN